MYLTYEQVKKLVFRTGNRPVKMSHVKELISKKELIKNGKWDMHEAVLVNILTNVILNGQHRVTAYLWAIENGIIPKDTLLKVDYDEVPVEEELNVKKVTFTSDTSVYMNYVVKPNFKEVGKLFGKNIKEFQNKLLELKLEEIEKLNVSLE